MDLVFSETKTNTDTCFSQNPSSEQRTTGKSLLTEWKIIKFCRNEKFENCGKITFFYAEKSH